MQTDASPPQDLKFPQGKFTINLRDQHADLEKIRRALRLTIPREMQNEPRWLHWRNDQKYADKPSMKVPYDVHDPQRKKKASTTNSTTWATFDHATLRLTATLRLGWVLQPPYIGIDIDHCVQSDGELGTIAQAILDRFPTTYAEWSPSGTGIHVFLKGNLPQAHKTSLGEIYTTARYFTVTGNVLPQRPASIAYASDSDVAWVLQQLQAPSGTRQTGATLAHIDYTDLPPWVLTGVLPSDMQKVLYASNTRFEGLWEKAQIPQGAKGDETPSAYDMALARMTARAGYDAALVLAVIMCWRAKHNLTKGMHALQTTATKALDFEEERRIFTCDDRPAKFTWLKKFFGLNIERLVEIGEHPAWYYFHLAGQPRGVLIGTFDDFMSYKHWRALAFETGGNHLNLTVPGKDAKKWKQIEDMLMKCVSHTPDPDIGINGETESWLSGYFTDVTRRNPTAQDLRNSTAFVLPDGTRYLITDRFLTHVHISCGIRGITRDELGSRLTVLGWQTETVQLADTGGVIERVYRRST